MARYPLYISITDTANIKGNTMKKLTEQKRMDELLIIWGAELAAKAGEADLELRYDFHRHI